MAHSSVHLGMLRNVPLFAVLDEVQLNALATVVSRRSFPKNRVVLQAGDPTENLTMHFLPD